MSRHKNEWSRSTVRQLLMVGLAGLGASTAVAQQAAPLVFDHVTVVDVEQGQLLPDQRVVIADNRIRAMGAAGATALPNAAQVVDATGRYLIPGLWDVHVHPREAAADIYYPLFIVYGITGIRDAGSNMPLPMLRQWQQEILAGTRVGPPRQILEGPLLNGESGQDHVVKADSTNARHLVDSLAAAGADMIKLREVDRATYFAAAAEARRLGIPFGGHIAHISAREASDSGARIVDHIQFMEECWGAKAAVDSCRLIADQFRRNDTWWAPTLVAYQSILNIDVLGARGARFFDQKRFLQQIVGGFWVNDSMPTSFAHDAAPASARDSVRSGDSIAYGAVVQQVSMPLLAGTDASPGFPLPPGVSLHAELALMVAGGVTPLLALQSATLNPAKMWHATDSLGTIAAGKLADLVLLDANPLEDIANTLRIRAVVANGRYFDRSDLDVLQTLAKAKHQTVAVLPVDKIAGKTVAVLPTPSYGRDGLPGRDSSGLDAEVDSLLDAALARRVTEVKWVPAAQVLRALQLHSPYDSNLVWQYGLRAALFSQVPDGSKDSLLESARDEVREHLRQMGSAVGAQALLIPITTAFHSEGDRVCVEAWFDLFDLATGTPVRVWRSHGDLGILTAWPGASLVGCGATRAMALAHMLAVALPGRAGEP